MIWKACRHLIYPTSYLRLEPQVGALHYTADVAAAIGSTVSRAKLRSSQNTSRRRNCMPYHSILSERQTPSVSERTMSQVYGTLIDGLPLGPRASADCADSRSFCKT